MMTTSPLFPAIIEWIYQIGVQISKADISDFLSPFFVIRFFYDFLQGVQLLYTSFAIICLLIGYF